MKKDVRNMLIMLGIGVIVVALGVTYLTSTYAGPPTEEGLRVSLEESKAAYDTGDGVIVDVRNQEEFDKLRIPGSLLMPINDMEGNEPDVPLDTNIYLYCTWPAENLSARAAQYLQDLGFENAKAIVGGFAAWIDAGYPIEGTET